MKKRTVNIILISTGIIISILLFLLINKVFCEKCGTYDSSIDSIEENIQSKFNKELSKKNTWLTVFPSTNDITIIKGDSPKGFAFAVRNKNNEPNTYFWEVSAESEFNYMEECGITTNKNIADHYLLLGAGIFRVGAQEDNFENSILVKFDIPKTANNCTIPYTLKVEDSYNLSKEEIIYVKITDVS